jgi:RHH-type transcriptional regulator, proline utilization regulon repressor / proline dehydrogenase / delta 1-pyrroline-5-carboxylate dehydrogenase
MSARTPAARRWLFDEQRSPLDQLGGDLAAHYLADEAAALQRALRYGRPTEAQTARIGAEAAALVAAIRTRQRRAGGIDALLGEYDLSSGEGIVLMCLAEALLRIPDATTADRLIADKLASADWHAHLGTSESLFVNVSTWALLLTGRIAHAADVAEAPGTFLKRLVGRVGEPVVRTALRQAMRILGEQFVMGETIEAALARAAHAPRFVYSFDMLGEAALTAADARRYGDSYAAAIAAVGARVARGTPMLTAPSISVKLSALSPRYEFTQAARAVDEVARRLLALATAARDAGVGLTVDAEEADRLELSLAIFARVHADAALVDWPGLGIAVQAYQKCAPDVLKWLERRARAVGRLIPVRLVKGAYWDSEIKLAQARGLDGYPVFTRKHNTDVAYLACAKALLTEQTHLFPQFATHNAHTVAWILEIGAGRAYEFQRLHGMGEELYEELLARPGFAQRCRVYAPVGSHEHLLPYLVRRLLENGANTSFVNRLVDAEAPAATLVADPFALAPKTQAGDPRIPLPADLFGPTRRNSRGRNLASGTDRAVLAAELASTAPGTWTARPIVGGESRAGEPRDWRDPADQDRVVGTVYYADARTARAALDTAGEFQPLWNAEPAEHRADVLERAALLVEADTAELVARCVAETGRTVPSALDEVREAVDLLRYYAAQCRARFAEPRRLPGPTGESNELSLVGRGVFVCISPWNFPAAIFTGQVAAALAAGNTAIAKPAEQASLTAARIVELLQRAGMPAGALQFLPGDGAALGAALLGDPRIAGVAFTGSVETARAINRALANRAGPIATLIAETGGINAMIVDSSALPEQVVRDAAQSAFDSAGQRCSALRLLCLQEEIADEVLRILKGWLDEIVIGDPALLATDVGPVIDRDAHAMLTDYLATQRDSILHQCRLDARHARGLFVPPTILEIPSATALTREIFGPVLHVVRYRAVELDALVDALNANGFGLTLGIQTRIDSVAERIVARARVGNVYVNRNMIGAQIGVQPFGGMGLSGTGPKAGGPEYVPRFAIEQTLTTNTAAVGGNATLLALGPDGGE